MTLISKRSSLRRSSLHLLAHKFLVSSLFSPLLVISVNILLLIDFLNYMAELFMCLLPFVCMDAKWPLNGEQSSREALEWLKFKVFKCKSLRYRQPSDTWHARIWIDKSSTTRRGIWTSVRDKITTKTVANASAKVHMLTQSPKIFAVVAHLINQQHREWTSLKPKQSETIIKVWVSVYLPTRAAFCRHNETSCWAIVGQTATALSCACE